jgi:hypothetical protein
LIASFSNKKTPDLSSKTGAVEKGGRKHFPVPNFPQNFFQFNFVAMQWQGKGSSDTKCMRFFSAVNLGIKAATLHTIGACFSPFANEAVKVIIFQ